VADDLKAAREHLRRLTRHAADQAEASFQKSVRPIYAVDKRSKPTQIGSSVLLEHNGQKLLVTAAHVIDHNEDSSLYIAGNGLIPLTGNFELTVSPKGNRDHDRYDFAVGALSSSLVSQLDGLKYIDSRTTVKAEEDISSTYFTVLGYPNSKNKTPYNDTKHLKGYIYSYSNGHKFKPALARMIGVSGEDHLFIDHKKLARDEAGAKTFAISPKGLSGGPIVQSADFSNREVLLGKVQPVPRLAGITIRLFKRENALLGTRISTILEGSGLGATAAN